MVVVVKPRKVLSSFRNLVSPVAVLFSRHADAGARALVSCFCFASVSVCVCVLFRLGFVAGAAVSAASLCLFVFSISRLLSSLSHTFSSLRCNSSSSSTSKLLDCNQSPCVFTPLPPYLTVPCIIASSSSSSLVVSLCDSSHWTFLRLRLLSLSSPVFVCLPLLLAPAASTRRAITLQYQRFLGISSVVS